MKTASGIFLLFLLSSCAIMYEFPIEVFQPAKADLSPKIKNVTLVSRNLKYTNDTLQNYYSKNYKLTRDLRTENNDSIVIAACFDSLSNKMEEQGRFNKITVLPVSSLPKRYLKRIVAPSRNLVQKISSDTNADAIIFLDMFSGFYSVYPTDYNNQSIAQVVTASVWTIYNPINNQILHHTSLIDTIYWDGMDDQDHYKAISIPNKTNALAIAAGLAGIKYSEILIPHWSQVYRQTFSSNKIDFRNAAQLAKKNQWKEASVIWEKYTNSNNKRYRLHSLYNLAVANEMEGNIDNAIKLLSDASTVSKSPFYTNENKSIRKYAGILAKRQIELNKINSLGYEE